MNEIKRGLQLAYIVAAAAIALSACGPIPQTSSGREYLSRYETVAKVSGNQAALDEFIRNAANVEPILALSARFGLARIVNGRLSAVPVAE